MRLFNCRLQFCCAVFLFFLLISPLILAQAAQEISYAQAVQMALHDNPRSHVTGAQIESAEATLAELGAASLPKLNLQMNAARSDDPLTVFGSKLSQGNVSFADFGLNQYTGPASINTKPQALNNPAYYTNFNSALRVTIPLYAGGASVAKKKRAQALLCAARQGHQAARMQLAYDILQAYEAVRASAKLIKIAENAAHLAKTDLKMTESLLKQAQVIESDVLLAKTYQRNAKMTIAEARIEWQNHLDAFRLLIGQPHSHYVPGHAIALPKTSQSLSSLMKNALAHNPHLRAIQSKIHASRANIAAADANHFPQVNLELRHDWNANLAGANFPSNTAALAFDWLIFSSGEQSATVRKAAARFKQVSFEFDEAANTIRQALLEAKRAAQLAKMQYQTSLENTALAEKSCHLLSARYGRGLLPLSQLLESQLSLDRARNMAVFAQYHQVLAEGRLLMLTNALIKPAKGKSK